VIPAQRNRAPPCQIVADAAFLEPLKIGLKVLTHPLKDLGKATNQCLGVADLDSGRFVCRRATPDRLVEIFQLQSNPFVWVQSK
jgi:hypothetical protein